MKNKPIKDLDSLKEHIASLHEQKEQLENKLGERWKYLQKEYPALIRKSFFNRYPLLQRAGTLYTLFGLQNFSDKLNLLSDKISSKAESVLLHWMDKLISKKQASTENEL